VSWTVHALDKARQFGFARSDIEDVVLGGHRGRRRNTGEAGWKVASGSMVVVYDYPDGNDDLTARVVTVWRR
jgi:hypothetical protein